jgi:hypothetical protein
MNMRNRFTGSYVSQAGNSSLTPPAAPVALAGFYTAIPQL